MSEENDNYTYDELLLLAKEFRPEEGMFVCDQKLLNKVYKALMQFAKIKDPVRRLMAEHGTVEIEKTSSEKKDWDFCRNLITLTFNGKRCCMRTSALKECSLEFCKQCPKRESLQEHMKKRGVL